MPLVYAVLNQFGTHAVISTDWREWRNLPVESRKSLGLGLRPALGMTYKGI